MDIDDGHVSELSQTIPSEGKGCVFLVTAKLNDLDVQVSLNNQDSIRFDSKEQLVTHLPFLQISDLKSAQKSIWNCVNTSACLDYVSDQRGSRMRVAKGTGSFYPDVIQNNDNGNNSIQFLNGCEVQDGLYDLYAGTLIPRTLVLRSDCKMLSFVDPTNGGLQYATLVQFTAGSILTINPSAIVLSFIPGAK